MRHTTCQLNPWLKSSKFGYNFFLHLADVLATKNFEPGRALHPKMCDSLPATVQCQRLYCHLLNFLAAGSNFFIWNSDIIGHVHDKVLEPPCFLSSEQLSFFLNFAFKTRLNP